MEGSMDFKSFAFKTKLAWACGRLNARIEVAAERGEGFTYMYGNYGFARKYYAVMKKIYEGQGYRVAYNFEPKTNLDLPTGFGVYWCMEKVPYDDANMYNNSDYHTPIGELKLGNIRASDIKDAVRTAKILANKCGQGTVRICMSEAERLRNLAYCGEQVVHHLQTGATMDVRRDLDINK